MSILSYQSLLHSPIHRRRVHALQCSENLKLPASSESPESPMFPVGPVPPDPKSLESKRCPVAFADASLQKFSFNSSNFHRCFISYAICPQRVSTTITNHSRCLVTFTDIGLLPNSLEIFAVDPMVDSQKGFVSTPGNPAIHSLSLPLVSRVFLSLLLS